MANAELEERGFVILRSVYAPEELDRIRESCERALTSSGQSGSLLSREGAVYAARNVLEWWPLAREVWRVQPLVALLTEVLGTEAGLVRALYFDKPRERSWALPWHKDLTIAVKDNSLASTRFVHPTFKAGVAHVEAPLEVLQSMLTLRIFLDHVTEDNGPLRVIPGSHRDKEPARAFDDAVATLGQAGDVLAMRPLIAHASGHSNPETPLRRRTLHLEFAASHLLDDGFEWHTYLKVQG